MTALKDYVKLETTGLWRASADAQRREVVVSFGDATLVISDMSGRPLTHWSLAAVIRQNPKERPALFTPHDEPDAETLEIEDEDMIAAIGKVQRIILKSRPRPGRLRWGIIAAMTIGLVWLVFVWLPGAMITHAVKVVPDVKRAEIGAALLERSLKVAGRPCRDPFGRAALRDLSARMSHETQITVLRSGIATTASLPGGAILLGRGVIEDHDAPEVTAGYILAEAVRGADGAPLVDLLEATAPWGAFELLTRGEISAARLDAYAETFLVRAPAPVATDALIPAFAAADVPSTPYAYALDVTGETTLDLIEADPVSPTGAEPLLGDGPWLALQNICEE